MGCLEKAIKSSGSLLFELNYEIANKESVDLVFPARSEGNEKIEISCLLSSCYLFKNMDRVYSISSGGPLIGLLSEEQRQELLTKGELYIKKSITSEQARIYFNHERETQDDDNLQDIPETSTEKEINFYRNFGIVAGQLLHYFAKCIAPSTISIIAIN